MVLLCLHYGPVGFDVVYEYPCVNSCGRIEARAAYELVQPGHGLEKAPEHQPAASRNDNQGANQDLRALRVLVAEVKLQRIADEAAPIEHNRQDKDTGFACDDDERRR